MKRCPRCGETDISRFQKNATRPDGLQLYCKTCKNEFQREFMDKRKEHPPLPPPEKRFCRYDLCAKEFKPSYKQSGHQAYCSRLCSKRHWVRKNRKRHNATVRRNMLRYRSRETPEKRAKRLAYGAEYQKLNHEENILYLRHYNRFVRTKE